MLKAYKLMFRNYFKFKGRTTRSEYWLAILMNIIVSFVLSFLLSLMFPSGVVEALVGLYSLVLLIPMLSLNVRRLHDVGWSGWIIILMYAIWIVVLCISSGSILLIANGQIEAAMRATPWGVVAGLSVIDGIISMWWFILTLLKSGPDNKWGPRRTW